MTHRPVDWTDPETGERECRVCGETLTGAGQTLRHASDPAVPLTETPQSPATAAVVEVVLRHVARDTAQRIVADLVACGLLTVPRGPVDRQHTVVGRDHPGTARAAAQAALPRSGSFRAEVLRLIIESDIRGMTDDEIEEKTGQPHQTVSARRNGLAADGWIVERNLPGMPPTRDTRSGRAATVWVATAAASTALAATR